MSNELYGTNHIASIEEAANSDAVFEMFLVDDIMHNTSDEIQKFCESAEAQVLIEKQVLNKPTIIRMSKAQDYKRRVKLLAYQCARDAKDPLWEKLVKYQALKKQYAAKILTKYGKKAERMAKIAQKAYIKKAKSVKATAEEQKVQNAQAPK